MLTWIREKFGTVVIGGVIVLVGFVFVVSGVFNPKATRGMHAGAVAGKVNGESISLAEFNRELNRRVEFFKGMAGGKISEDQIRAFGIRKMVFDSLVQRKLVVQEAYNQGMLVSDEQVRDSIQGIPAFQKDGKFDLLTYRQVLQANQYTPGGFERLIREDLSAQQWDEYFRRRAQVSQDEVKREFLSTQDKRKIKYVLLSTESGRKALQIKPEEIQKLLADPAKMSLVKTQYEAQKEVAFKGKTLDQAKEAIAREMISGDRLDEVQKSNDKLAEEIKAVLTAEKSSDAKVTALAKAAGAEIKSTEWVTRSSTFIPGIGDATPVIKDAFAKTASQGLAKEARKYALASGALVAVIAEAQRADPAKLDAEKDGLFKQLVQRKQRALFQSWMSDLTKKADIDPNPSVVEGES